MGRVIIHVDMDAFYASVEQLDSASLRGVPVIVGGTSNRGVVSAASYEARRFGVRSAMPIFEARKRCPQGVFLPVRMSRYKEVSREVMEILEGFTPLVEQISIDEAYLDVSGMERILGTPDRVGFKIKEEIKEATSLTCSVGIAPNKFLAKIASDMDKPDGLIVIKPDEALGVIENLPIEDVPGVGGKSVQRLKELGVRVLADIKKAPEGLLIERTGKFGKRLLNLSRGVDESPVCPYTEAKSLSSENTLPEDTNDMEVLKRQLLVQSETVGRRMRERGLRGTTVTLKLKGSDFKQITRSATLEGSTDSTNIIYCQGLKLLENIDVSRRFRLIGIGVSNFVTGRDGPEQLDLFGKEAAKGAPWEDVEKALDTIRERFGNDAIKRGSLCADDNGL